LGRRKRSLLAGGRGARDGGGDAPDDASDELDGPDETGEEPGDGATSSEPASSETAPASSEPMAEPASSEPVSGSATADVVDEFAKDAAVADAAGARPELEAPKPGEDDDDWYLRTGQPAPAREDDGDEPIAPQTSDLRHYGPALALIGGIALLFVLILLFGVLLS